MGNKELAEGWYEGQETIDVGMRIDQPLTMSGDEDDPNYEMAGTGTAVAYYVGPPPTDETWNIRRLLLSAIDANWNNALNYGALGAPLPTGINVDVVDGNDVVLYHFTQVPIKRTHDWTLYAGVDALHIGGAGADPFMVRWTFSKGGYDIKLEGKRGMRLRLTKPDDITGLDSHIVSVQGYKKKGGGG